MRFMIYILGKWKTASEDVSVRRHLAWVLIVCLCVVNLNTFTYAAEDALIRAGLHTASNWKTDETASASDADVAMPEDMLKAGELLDEAERAVTNGYNFDFEKMIRLLDVSAVMDEELILDEDNDDKTVSEQYKEIFNGYEVFALFYDNGKFGRLVSEASENAYGYILIRLNKEDYGSYISRAGRPASPSGDVYGEATASDAGMYREGMETATASNANAESRKRYMLTGREDLIFLYVNGTDMDVTFSLNLTDAVAPEILIPGIGSVAEHLITDTEEDDELWEEELINDLPDQASPSDTSLSRSLRQVSLVGAQNPEEETAEELILEEEADDGTREWNIDDEDIPFEVWQKLVGGEEEDACDDQYDTGSEEEDSEVKRVRPFLLPMAVGSIVPQRRTFLRSVKAAKQDAVVRASVLNVGSLRAFATGYYKQIEKGAEEEYTLHLGVSGKNQALDVLLIIDRSGSMDNAVDGYGSPTRIATLKKVLADNNTGFVDRIMDSTDHNSRFAVVTYGDYGERVLNWSDQAASIKNAVKGITILHDYYGNGTVEGTNYEDGLWVGKEVLGERGNSDRVPVVIFLSDGIPSFYNMDFDGDAFASGDTENESGSIFNPRSQNWNSTGAISNSSIARKGVAGNGQGDAGRTGVQTRVAAKGFYQFAHDEVGANIFSVGFGKNFDKTYLNYVARGENDSLTHPNVIAGNDLANAFSSILDSLVFKNVKIKDTLSDYVDLSDPIHVGTVWKIVDGEKEPLAEGRDYKSLRYNSDTRQVVLEFGEDTVLEEHAVYELEFKIKTNDAAKKHVSQSGHTDVGDPDTDYKDNRTSAGQPGLFSNKEAVASFGRKDEMSITYPKPVVQVPVDPIANRKYIKDNKDGTYKLTLDVTAKVGGIAGSTREYPLDLVFVLDKSTSMSKDIDGKKWPDQADKRVTKVNAAVKELIDTISGELGTGRFQYNAVHFSGTAIPPWTAPDWAPDWTFGKDVDVVYKSRDWAGVYDILVRVKAPDWPLHGNPSDSTMPNFAIEEAVSILNKGSNTNINKEGLKKAVIFLTDGDPSDRRGEISRVADAVKDIDPSTMFYSIAYSKDTSLEYLTALDDALRAKNVSSRIWSAADNTALKVIFEEITAALTSTSAATPGVSNITISDTLSGYADFVSTGQESIEVIVDGEVLTAAQEAEYGITKLIDGKTVKVTFPNEMPQDSVYAISFKVKPSAAAKEYYGKHGAYPDIGESDTDVPGMEETEWTSSGKDGFASNEAADVTYIYNGSTSSESYPVPVLQVRKGRLRIRKLVEGHEGGAEAEDFIIHLEKDGTGFADLVLKGDGRESSAIEVYGDAVFTVTESVPKEYKLSGFMAADVEKPEMADGAFITDGNTARIMVGPGDDIVVTVMNEFAHKPYFHADADVTNRTTGNRDQPFDGGRDAAKKLALSQETAMLMDNGPKEVILEESDRLV